VENFLVESWIFVSKRVGTVIRRPQEIDEAARRRFVKRLYVPLPQRDARKQIVELLMSRQPNSLNADQFTAVCDRTEGL